MIWGILGRGAAGGARSGDPAEALEPTAPVEVDSVRPDSPAELGDDEGAPAAAVRRRRSLRRPAIRLVRVLRTMTFALALLLAATMVDSSTATMAGQEPTDGAEFAAMPGDDSLQLPPEEPLSSPAAAVGQTREPPAPQSAPPTTEPPAPPSAPATTEPTAAIVTAAPSISPADPTAGPAAPATIPAIPTTPRVTYRTPTDRPVVALTFDDGWSGENGRLILDILVREQVPATFFLNGTYLAGNLQLWRDVANAGFAVGNHTWRHSDVTKLSTDQIVADLQQNAAAFQAATGHQMAPLFRPPYGFRNAATDAAAALAGFPDIVMWDTTDNDTRRYSDSDVIATGVAGQPGSIVLLHVGPSVTPRILEQLLHGYWDRGFGFVPLMDLLYPDGYPSVPAPTPEPSPSPAATPLQSPSPTERASFLTAR